MFIQHLGQVERVIRNIRSRDAHDFRAGWMSYP